MVRSFNLTVGAVPTRLSDVYGGPAGVIDAALDIPYRQVFLQAATGDVKIGDQNVSTTVYGVLVPFTAPATPIVLGPFESGPIKLSQIYAIGGGPLHILGIPF